MEVKLSALYENLKYFSYLNIRVKNLIWYQKLEQILSKPIDITVDSF